MDTRDTIEHDATQAATWLDKVDNDDRVSPGSGWLSRVVYDAFCPLTVLIELSLAAPHEVHFEALTRLGGLTDVWAIVSPDDGFPAELRATTWRTVVGSSAGSGRARVDLDAVARTAALESYPSMDDEPIAAELMHDLG